MKPNFILALAAALSLASAAAQNKNITLQDIFVNGTFRVQSVQLPSLSNGLQYLSLDNDTLSNNIRFNIYDYKSGKKIKALLNTADVIVNGKPLQFSKYSLSNNQSKILFSAQTENIYRHSTRSFYYVHDLALNKTFSISPHAKVQQCFLSPSGNHAAFVRDNNLVIWNAESQAELPITLDGKKNSIINGVPDWVYEEEFSFSKAYEWSPSGDKIAWLRFDESNVSQVTLTYYDSLYPRLESYKYPKAGQPNSVVQVYIYNLATGKTVMADVGNITNQYIPRILWADSNRLGIVRLNRLQNKVDILLCDAKTGASQTILTEHDSTFIDMEHSAHLAFINNGKHFVWMSYRDKFNNIYIYNINGSLVKQLTTDKKDVLDYYGYDPEKKTFYYQSYESSPADRQVYSITWDGKKNLLAHSSGTNEAQFSPGFKYFVNTWSGANSVPVYELYSAGGKLIRVLEDNNALRLKLSTFNISPVQFFSIKTGDSVTLQAYMIKPPDFTPQKKYPVLMYVYGGPSSPLVLNDKVNAREYWLHMIAQKGYIILCVDNRGTTRQGYDFLRCTYANLGKLETIDQVGAAKWLMQQPYVDAARIGIFGWSYGGYLASLCMTKAGDVFKMGIAVAPVTNWRYYDTIYTERYLRTPQENPKGYDDNSPVNFAEGLKGKFLLAAGIADDNVHFQNSMMFQDRLIKHNIQFTSMNYPNRAHSISGGGASMHLYTLMTDFILANL